MSGDELVAVIREVRDRVRARHPQTTGGPAEIVLPDLMPVAHARDAAEGKVAAIGTVNPRRGGPLNALIQFAKRTVARALDWHVREQVEFNRHMIAAINANLETLNNVNRTFVELANRIQELHRRGDGLASEAAELKDIRSHWNDWRLDWERKLAHNEMQYLRSVAELQTAFQQRATLMEGNFRDIVRTQHAAFEGAAKTQHAEFQSALDSRAMQIQERLWADLERMRSDYEQLIHSELRLIRQRAATAPHSESAIAGIATPLPRESSPQFDYMKFADRFRGSEEYVRGTQKFYLSFFQNCRNVLDIGCGRGEFLELMRDARIPAHGVEWSEESVALCRSKGLQAHPADLFDYLGSLSEASLDGIFCAQVVEHLPPDRLPEMIRLAASRLAKGGVLIIETPNPECLAIFAVHFYLDPTHQRPVPHPLLAFYMEEHGLGRIEVHKRSPALESMPALGSLPSEFREAFFGGLDYAIVGRKLG